MKLILKYLFFLFVSCALSVALMFAGAFFTLNHPISRTMAKELLIYGLQMGGIFFAFLTARDIWELICTKFTEHSYQGGEE
jgi:hypothetical protein